MIDTREKAQCFMCPIKAPKETMTYRKIGGKLRSVCPRCTGTICRPLNIVDTSRR